MLAYMCFYQDDELAQAKALVAQYKNFPVARWADLFKQVSNSCCSARFPLPVRGLTLLYQVADSIAELEQPDSVTSSTSSDKPLAPSLNVDLKDTTIAIVAKVATLF